ncbi:hypothetical protein JYT48_00635 [Mariprofundus ferrooxydans]|nr:hypothetical protein [Mariprofundus ferrooxydans]
MSCDLNLIRLNGAVKQLDLAQGLAIKGLICLSTESVDNFVDNSPRFYS